METIVAHHTNLLANDPTWGSHAHSIELVIPQHAVTNFHTPGLTFHVSDNGVDISVTPKPNHQTSTDYLRTLDVVKVLYRLGKATKGDLNRAATNYRDKVWADCDRARKRRPSISIDNLMRVR